MKKIFGGNQVLPILILLLAFAVSSSDARPPQKTAAVSSSDLSGYPVPPKDAHPKIDSILWDQTRGKLSRRAGPGPEKISAVENDGLIRIVAERNTFLPRSARAIEGRILRDRIETLGGCIEGESENDIQVLLAPDKIELLALSPNVSRLRLPLIPREAAVVSEGVAASGALTLSALPEYRTSGNRVKIAVLDLGFDGYAALAGTELPSDLVVRSFRANGDLEAGTAHGVACAEIVHDLAPDAKIYLVNFGTDVEQHAAVDYLISEKIDIVSYSLVWVGAGAGNGTGPICADVKKCAAAGILWVGAAGDDGQSHWEGRFSDSNEDSFQNFSGADEILQWTIPAGTETKATLTWNDWGTWDGSSYGKPTRDFDLLFWRWTGSAWELLEYCDDWQTGESGQKPLEQSSIWKSDVATLYGVSILNFDASADVTLELVVQGNSEAIEYAVPEGSLAIPADAAESISVGATDFLTDVLQASSSRGPTHDNRIKPDLSAFSGVSTSTYGSLAFSGTSAAAPHVAGAFALLMAKTPYTANELRTILELRALDLGTAGKDNLYGYGRLNLKKKTS